VISWCIRCAAAISSRSVAEAPVLGADTVNLLLTRREHSQSAGSTAPLRQRSRNSGPARPGPEPAERGTCSNECGTCSKKVQQPSACHRPGAPLFACLTPAGQKGNDRRVGSLGGLGAGVLVSGRSWQDGPGDSGDVAVIGAATASQHCDVRACRQQALVVGRQLTGPLTGIYDPNGMGAMFFAVLAAAQTERDYIREKTLEGQVTAAARGNHGGRPKVTDDGSLLFARALKDKGVPVPEIAKKLTIKTGKNAGKSPVGRLAVPGPGRSRRARRPGRGSPGLAAVAPPPELMERLERQVPGPGDMSRSDERDHDDRGGEHQDEVTPGQRGPAGCRQWNGQGRRQRHDPAGACPGHHGGHGPGRAPDAGAPLADSP
jgi:hypothetical protein